VSREWLALNMHCHRYSRPEPILALDLLDFYCRCSSHDEIQEVLDALTLDSVSGPWIRVLKTHCPNLNLSAYRYQVQAARRRSRRRQEQHRRTAEDQRRSMEDRRRMIEDHKYSAWFRRQERSLERRRKAPEEEQEELEQPGQYQAQWEHNEQNKQQDVYNGRELQNENNEGKGETRHEDEEQVYCNGPESPDPESKVAEAQQAELANWNHDMRESKEELLERGVPLSSDGVVILRLTKCARAPEVLEALQGSPMLERCHKRLEAAGCVMTPEWTDAKLLVPLPQELVTEFLEGSDLQLAHHHIIALSEDIDIIKAVLRTISPNYKQCPRLKPEHYEAVLTDATKIPLPSSSIDCEAEEEDDEADDGSAVDVVAEQYHAWSTDSEVGFPGFST